jgi:hypothetical protein
MRAVRITVQRLEFLRRRRKQRVEPGARDRRLAAAQSVHAVRLPASPSPAQEFPWRASAVNHLLQRPLDALDVAPSEPAEEKDRQPEEHESSNQRNRCQWLPIALDQMRRFQHQARSPGKNRSLLKKARQVVTKISSGPIPPVRVALKAFHEHSFQIFRHGPVAPSSVRGIARSSRPTALAAQRRLD